MVVWDSLGLRAGVVVAEKVCRPWRALGARLRMAKRGEHEVGGKCVTSRWM